jgi:hypothetical protein
MSDPRLSPPTGVGGMKGRVVDLPDVDLDDWWDGFYELRVELYVAEPTTLT